MSEGGILAIKGVKSQYYISMNKAGQLQGKVIFFLSERSHALFSANPKLSDYFKISMCVTKTKN